MRYLRFTLLPLLLIACTERQPAAPEVDVVPNFDAALVVNDIQYRHPVRTINTDGVPGWDYALFGFEPGDWDVCHGGDPTVGGIKVRDHIVVTHAEDDFDLNDGDTWAFGEAIHEMVTTIGRPPMYAYTRASFDAATDLCDWAMNDWFAVGSWHALISADNDVSGWDDTPSMNVFGSTEGGMVVGMDGTRYKYKNIYRILYQEHTGAWKLANDFWSFEPIGN